jgi:hypothetical protein
MDERDIALRSLTYGLFCRLGRAPTHVEVAQEGGWPIADVAAGWRRLHDAHALVLDDTGEALRMANPFSAVPTAHRVLAGGRWWYANCAWDAFGICAALGVDGRIESSCPDCAEPLSVDVRGQLPSDESMVFFCPLPAARWWDDIVFT